ncbi:AzlC family ABC transporter permease [uncultured Clostridium sp.]|uniref:AzlC family ABC transporter permease n=1 Tax=uncultured Clostridium sp. TaxID=59620 RepID=UPI0028EE712D|nr:AzlC family ABC transporter permease [uncultured Clostridium sp.]
MEKRDKVSYFKEGIRLAMPIAIGYVPIAITFGLITKSSGVSNEVGIMMSIMVFAGASQFIGVNLMALGSAPLEIIVTTFIINFRHFLMSSSLSQKVKENTDKKLLYLISFGITDETFAVASLKEEGKLNPYVILGLNFTSYLSWVFGTIFGVALGNVIPEVIKNSMGIALYAMFIGLLVPALKKSKPILVISLLSIGINTLIMYIPIFAFISKGWSIVISTMISSLVGALMFKEGM